MARIFAAGGTRLGMTARRQGTKGQRRARLTVESLEDRTVPSITINAAGLVTVVGTDEADHFLIRVDPTMATQLQFSDDGGKTFTSFAAASVTAVDVQGLGGADTLALDNSFGLVGGANLPITFEGGKGFDALFVFGDPKGAPVTETYTVGTNFGEGMLAIGDGTTSATITFTSVESVVDVLTADQLTINANDDPNLIRINAGPMVNNVQVNTVHILSRAAQSNNGSNDDHNQGNDDNNQGNDDNNQGDDDDQGENLGDFEEHAFTPITFANKTNVTINGLGGNDVFILNDPHPAAGLKQLTLDGGDGMDVLIEVNVPSGVTLTTTNFEKTVVKHDDAEIDDQFEELLGREVDSSGLNSWKSAMHNGLDLAGLVAGIENSAEARTLFVKRLYTQYLGRSAQNGEEQTWVNALMRGDTEENIIADIVGSAEFQQRAQSMTTTGSASQRTVAALYSVLLGRAADAQGAAAWTNYLQTAGTGSVALGMLHSAEFRTSAVDSMYQSLLGRAADAGGLQAWAGSDLDLRGIRRGIEASPEFAQDD